MYVLSTHLHQHCNVPIMPIQHAVQHYTLCDNEGSRLEVANFNFNE